MVSNELLQKAKKCTTREEILELAKSNNVEVSEDEIKALLATSGTNRELSDEELENVTGGTCYSEGVACNSHMFALGTNTDNYNVVHKYAIVSPLNSCSRYKNYCMDCGFHFVVDATWYCGIRWEGNDFDN